MLRRVVTGHTPSGASTVISDGPIPRSSRLSMVPDMSSSLAWSTSPGTVAKNGDDPTATVASFVPEAGETRLLVLTIPPDMVYSTLNQSPAEIAAERRTMSPGLAELFEVDNPGMHRTPTVDYGFVLSGEIWLELDDGNLTHLRTGDIIVQNQTRHAWRNKSESVATVAFVLVGTS